MIRLIENYCKELERRDKISRSLKSYHAIKKAEKGYHRCYVYEFGKCVGYTLLPNL